MQKFKGRIKGSTPTGNEELDYAMGDVIEELETGKVFICDLSHFNDQTLLKDVLIEVEKGTVKPLHLVNNKYEIFMKMLHDKGCVKSMQAAKNLIPDAPAELPESLKEAIKLKCVSSSISMSMQRDPELRKAFDDVACELMFGEVFKDLDLKKDENFKPTEMDLFAKFMAETIAKMMFKL